MKILKLIYTSSILLFLATGCVNTPQHSIVGKWNPPSGEGDYLEFIEGGALISHMELEGVTKSSMRIENTPYVDIPGTWKIINNTELVMTFEYSNETILATNTITRISEEQIELDGEKGTTIYTKAN